MSLIFLGNFFVLLVGGMVRMCEIGQTFLTEKYKIQKNIKQTKRLSRDYGSKVSDWKEI